MIEIEFNENTSVEEFISLFVDINQKGVKVTRLQIVRALMNDDPFLKDVYGLVAVKQKRQQSILVKKKNTDFASVLSKLQIIYNVENMDQKADRMWERLFELALYARSGKHRKPSEIIKSFIGAPTSKGQRITAEEKRKLYEAFAFLANAYKTKGLKGTRFATDQTHFYTLATTLIGTAMLKQYDPADLALAIRTSTVSYLNHLLGSYRECKS